MECMSKTSMKTFVFTLVVILTSCRQSKSASYSTHTLDCLDELVTAEKQGITNMLAVANKYKSKFRFAEELEDRLKDKQCIMDTEILSASGKMDKAYQTLNNRIVERGFSDSLSSSLSKIQAAKFIQDYNENVVSDSWSISEQAREFSRIEANCSPHFRTSRTYISWITSQRELIANKVSKDKDIIQEGFDFFSDTLSLANPELVEICILQGAIFQKSSPLPRIKSSVNDRDYKLLTSLGSKRIIENNFYKKDIKIAKSPSTFNESLNNVSLAADGGKSILAIKSLQETTKEIEIAPNLRRAIMKKIIKSNGWNDSSLINSHLFDISYILETFYMANN